MSDEQPAPESDDSLDAGLLAGFGPPASDSLTGPSALAGLEERVGTRTRVLLRSEELDGTSPDDAPRDGGRRYRLLGEIARGGMGIIMRSRDNDLGRDVAMKVLQGRHAGNEAMVQRFVDEAQIAGQLQHPGVLQVYELGVQADRRPYFTMKLIKGRTLAALLSERSDPAAGRRQFLGIFERVCQTMAYVHARGVIHRDLKPANVMVGNFGEVQVVDWGLAKVLHRDRRQEPAAGGDRVTVIHVPRPGDSGSHSIAGSVMGTPAYMPPEQARGEVDELDERCDVFALGAILCEILTGAPAYRGDSATALEDARLGQLDEARRRLATCGADEELSRLAEACLAPRRRDRLADAQAVADRLSAHLASAEERARAAELAAVEARAKAAEERRARRLTLVMAASILAALLIGGGGIVWSQNERLGLLTSNNEEMNRQLNELVASLDEARDTSLSDEGGSWIALRAIGAHVAAMHGAIDLDDETRQRASDVLNEFSQADRDRRMAERVEQIVINGATHKDAESWLTMERGLREAFRDYGLDLERTPRDRIAPRILESDIGPQLTDALELWLAARAHLGPDVMPMEEASWVPVLYEADPDPYRVGIRRQVWSTGRDVETLLGLADSPDFDEAPPRTLSWLGGTLLAAGSEAGMDDVFRRALRLHPTDFMLNFDYAYQLDGLGRREEAIRYYHRALAIRPKVAGMWRTLGVALRGTGDLDGSADAFEQAIGYQGDYAPTWVDLGLTLAAAGDLDAAVDAYGQALSLRPDDAEALCHLGRALQASGRPEEALDALERGHALGSATRGWSLDSESWLEQCRLELGRDD